MSAALDTGRVPAKGVVVRLRSHELREELPGTVDHFRLEFDVTPK
ncbi:MAG: hypothetical protein ABIQ18_03260 [Umezawaea sp.]